VHCLASLTEEEGSHSIAARGWRVPQWAASYMIISFPVTIANMLWLCRLLATRVCT
jgi:hypothetical protein